MRDVGVDVPALLSGWHLLTPAGVPCWTHVQVKAVLYKGIWTRESTQSIDEDVRWRKDLVKTWKKMATMVKTTTMNGGRKK